MRPARLDHSFFDNEPRSHLGALLLRKGLVTNAELDQALEQRERGELLGEALVRLRICFEDDIARVLAAQACVDFVDIGITSVDRRAVELLPGSLAQRLRAIPLRLHPDGTVSVAVADPTDETLLAELKLALGQPVRLLVTTGSALRAAQQAAYPTH
jgi:type IV pilus assembly protein PilB